MAKGIDVLVCGVGTEEIITGISRYIKGEKKKKILSVAVLPDSGERYLRGPLFEGVFDEAGLPRI